MSPGRRSTRTPAMLALLAVLAVPGLVDTVALAADASGATASSPAQPAGDAHAPSPARADAAPSTAALEPPGVGQPPPAAVRAASGASSPAPVEAPASGASPFAALFAAVRLGSESPDAALARIGLPGATAASDGDPAALRARLLARGLVLAANGRERDARQVADTLRALDPAQHGALGLAAAELVLAQWYDNDGSSERSAAAARAAQSHFDAGCAAGCEPLPRWFAEMLSQQAAGDDGRPTPALRHLARAREFAAAAHSPVAQALTEVAAAWQLVRDGAVGPAAAQLAAAQQFAAAGAPDAALQARLLNVEGLIAIARDDAPAAQAALRAGLAVAEAAGLSRIGAVLLVNLADLELKHGSPRAALDALNRAAGPIRAHQDRRRERTLLHNLGLARIALGELAAGQRDIDAAQAMWLRAGARGDALVALREASEALAAAGQHAEALALYHRETELAEESMQANRDAALADVQGRFQRASQEREIELKAREQSLREALLENRQLQQRLWALVVAAALLAASATALLLRRLRRTQQTLAVRQALLRELSERDSLTGLSNRRHLQTELAQRRSGDGNFVGGVLLLDVDRFKAINDQLGHAAGDMVLRAVGERLVAMSRATDRVARWGGEEFVFVLPQATAPEVDALAGRLLDAVGATPVTLIDGRQWPVTVSIGWAVFPLPPHALALPWGPALSIADRLLYRAKAAGRNQAHGLAGAPGLADAAALRAVAESLDDAAADGRVQLWQRGGPERPADAAASPADTETADGAARDGDGVAADAESDQTRRTRTL